MNKDEIKRKLEAGEAIPQEEFLEVTKNSARFSN